MTSWAGSGGPGGPSGPQSSLGGWIDRQQQQFRDFDSSFGAGFGVNGFGGDGLGDRGFGDFPLVSPGLLGPRALPAPAALATRPAAASPGHEMGDDEMSPKAKVSYDQDKFQVEFNVKDYTPEVSAGIVSSASAVGTLSGKCRLSAVAASAGVLVTRTCFTPEKA
jgi:hypothetical protein